MQRWIPQQRSSKDLARTKELKRSAVETGRRQKTYEKGKVKGQPVFALMIKLGGGEATAELRQ